MTGIFSLVTGNDVIRDSCLLENDESSSRYFGDILQLTNWILDSGATCHTSPQVSNVIPCLLEDTDKYIECADGHHFIAKQKGQVQI